MSIKTWIPLAVALVLGLAAAKLVHDQIKSRNAPVADGGDLRAVVVAAEDISPGAELRPEVLKIAKISAAGLPPATFSSLADLGGRVAAIPVIKGQPLMESLLAPSGAGAGLQALIPAGMRAVTIEVNEFSGVAGLVVPGSRVDIVSTMQADEDHVTLSRTIVRDVEIKAVGQRMVAVHKEDEKEMFRSVTMLVTPEDAEKIELACAMSRPRLVLRGTGDEDSEQKTEGVTLAELRGDAGRKGDRPIPVEMTEPTTRPAQVLKVSSSDDPFAAPVVPSRSTRANQRTIQIIKGTAETSVTFEMTPPAGLLTDIDTDEVPGTGE